MMKPNGVLMVGSVPGASATEVMERVAAALPGRLQALPDGETGERWNYIGWQLGRFPPVCRRAKLGGTPVPASGPPALALADFGPTGYADAARESYAEFKQLRERGVVPPDVRFQVGLPSPFGVLVGHVKRELIGAAEPLYEQRFVETLRQIAEDIPHDDVVVQWDLCFEMTALEFDAGRLKDDWHRAYFPGDVLRGLVDRVERLSRALPGGVRLAFHLCYGDLHHRHFIEPQDAGLLVDLANALLAREALGPRTAWIHVPVPKDRTDAEYFAPLKSLRLDNSAGSESPRVYLGLVHASDEEGTRKRIETAQASVPFPFGVATECGLGRTPPEEIESVLGICREVSA
ncbi:hypothetical protein GGR52DRAFT_521906 [Hypoxylon sp. FL1284]|nr:hypothetical protein GGR52DRAFT_521906 [Hypoxylon sp. FL1284]